MRTCEAIKAQATREGGLCAYCLGPTVLWSGGAVSEAEWEELEKIGDAAGFCDGDCYTNSGPAWEDSGPLGLFFS